MGQKPQQKIESDTCQRSNDLPLLHHPFYRRRELIV
jgi:hypothetical protein